MISELLAKNEEGNSILLNSSLANSESCESKRAARFHGSFYKCLLFFSKRGPGQCVLRHWNQSSRPLPLLFSLCARLTQIALIIIKNSSLNDYFSSNTLIVQIFK